MKMPNPQYHLMSQVALTALLGEEYTRIVEGQSCTMETIKSLCAKGLVSLHPDLVPARPGLHYLVPAGALANAVADVSEWQYGELFSYFDDKGMRYNPDAPLHNLRHYAVVSMLH